MEQIHVSGEAEVQLGPRAFRIRRQFLDDLRQHPLVDTLPHLGKALLLLHAPLDDIVDINEASLIFGAARHPKSFVSLDGADHLLSRLADTRYAAGVIASWAQRYLSPLEEPVGAHAPGGEIIVTEGNRRFLREVSSDDHHWLADEPRRAGGDNQGPDPYEHLLAALGTCTSMTIRMYANRKGWPLEQVRVRLAHVREHDRDCAGCDEKPVRMEILQRYISLEGTLDDTQRQRLMEIADRCPVHRTLEGQLAIATESEAPA